MTSKVSCCALKAKHEEERHDYSLGITISGFPNFSDAHVSVYLELSIHMAGDILLASVSVTSDLSAVLKPKLTTEMPEHFPFFEMPQVPGSFCITNLPAIFIMVGESTGKEENMALIC